MTAKACVPPEVMAEVEAADKRKEEVLDRLLSKLGGEPPAGDPFERAIVDLIDADKRVVGLLNRGKAR